MTEFTLFTPFSYFFIFDCEKKVKKKVNIGQKKILPKNGRIWLSDINFKSSFYINPLISQFLLSFQILNL